MDKRKRVRFGCTLAPDVMDMLVALRPVLALTRTHIVERAVRDLYGREYDRTNGRTVERSSGRLDEQPASNPSEPPRPKNPRLKIQGEATVKRAACEHGAATGLCKRGCK